LAEAEAVFRPNSEFLAYNGEAFLMVKAQDVKVGDMLLGSDGLGAYFPARVTSVVGDTGRWLVIRAYLKYSKAFVNETCEHPLLKMLFDLREDVEVLCEVAWTDNYPVWTRNRGLITVGELQAGDVLGELYYDAGLRRLATGGVSVDFIEEYEFEGDVFDIKGESRFIYGRHLIGHRSKRTMVKWTLLNCDTEHGQK